MWFTSLPTQLRWVVLNNNFRIVFELESLATQSKSKTPITRSVHCNFNCITVAFQRTQHSIYTNLKDFLSNKLAQSSLGGICKRSLYCLHVLIKLYALTLKVLARTFSISHPRFTPIKKFILSHKNDFSETLFLTKDNLEYDIVCINTVLYVEKK